MPINLVLGKDEVGTLAGLGVVLDLPVETASLGVKDHQGIEGRTWLPNAKSGATTISYKGQYLI